MKYYIMTLGCQMNLSDTERIITVIESLGYIRTENEEEANLLGIVSCSVRQKAIDKVYTQITKWNKWKDSKNLLTFVSGCILPADEEKFLKRFDLLFRMEELQNLPSMIREYGVVTPLAENLSHDLFSSDLETFWHVKPHYSSDFEAFVPIQNGCDKFCSFCAVPYTRGREISRPSVEILAEVQKLVDDGYKSITLLGQNVNSYGMDKKGDELSFSQLLDKIGKMGESHQNNFWVYFTSPHPRDMGIDILEIIAKYPVLAKQIHLPLQSGDDKVLIHMNRNHDLSRYRDIVGNIHRIIPTATIFTDIIVGFSGETEEQFENTRLAMEEFQYHMAFIAQYSPRPGAKSSRWEDDISHSEKKRRLHILTDTIKDSSLNHNKNMIGKEVKILVEKKDRKSGYLSGRTEGKVLVRFPSDDLSLIGQFSNIKITSAIPMSMEGTIENKTFT